MNSIVMDESGCLGFDLSKVSTTKHILITFLLFKESRPISSLVKNTIATLPKIRKKKGAYLHAHYEKPITIKRFLSGLAQKDVEIATIRLDKSTSKQKENPNDLYTNMVVALINRLCDDALINKSEKIKFTASRRNTKKRLNDEFCESVKNSGKHLNIDVLTVKPSDDKCLQAVDFVSWAMWQKYEKSDDTYSKIIADKIIKEYVVYNNQ